MDILLLGRDDSITKTIEQMLCSESNWSIQRTNALNKQKWQRVKKLHDKKPFSIVLANLEGFSQPPPHPHQANNSRLTLSAPAGIAFLSKEFSH